MGRYKKLKKQEEQFLLNRLRNEWEAAERAQKLHTIATVAKQGGVVLAKSILAFTVIAGVLTVAAVAPNAFSAYGKLIGKPSRRFYEKSVFKEELRRMRKQGFVQARNTPSGYEIRITPKGKTRALRDIASNLAIKKQQKWDGTWWLVTFDIPRRHNAARNGLRENLKRIGMEPLQASVFISRYPCAEEVWFTARLFSIEHYVAIAHVDSIEGFGKRLESIL